VERVGLWGHRHPQCRERRCQLPHERHFLSLWRKTASVLALAGVLVGERGGVVYAWAWLGGGFAPLGSTNHLPRPEPLVIGRAGPQLRPAATEAASRILRQKAFDQHRASSGQALEDVDRGPRMRSYGPSMALW
jgi:hypothetical protein